MNGKSTFGFNSFTNKSVAVEDAFSKPIIRKRYQTTYSQQAEIPSTVDDNTLPTVSDETVTNLPSSDSPISIPETSSDGGNAETNLSDVEADIPAVQSLTSKKCAKSRLYEFDDNDEDDIYKPKQKKMKPEPTEDTKFIPRENKKPKYMHTWNSEELNDDVANVKEDTKKKVEKPLIPTTSSLSKVKKPGRVRNVKDANEILESGEYDDFQHDLIYILSTLNKTTSSVNVKCLSAVSLAKKCALPEFRQFLKTEGVCPSIFRAFADSPSNEAFALAAASVIYLLSRDFNSITIDASSLKLMAQLLRIETLGDEQNTHRISNMIWDVFNTYLQKQTICGKKLSFDFNKEQICPFSLMLESLVFISSRCERDDKFKTELLNLGVLQLLVAKVEICINRLTEQDDIDNYSMTILDRCFRILEVCSMLHKKNQAFLISHRKNTLINVLAQYLKFASKKVPQCEDEEKIKKLMSCLTLMARVLINLSHENELCSSKLGQIDGFLTECLGAFTFLAPKYAAEDKKFDLFVMMISLLSNLVERCNLNRKKVIELNIKYCKPDGTVEQADSLEILSNMYKHHESSAKTIDEDLDKEIGLEDPGEDEEDEDSNDGKIDRDRFNGFKEEDAVNMIHKVMNKACAHMEDSILASYLALLIGSLLQQNEEKAENIRKNLPEQSFAPMVAQLQRFSEFMKISLRNKGCDYIGCRSIEKIINFLERLE